MTVEVIPILAFNLILAMAALEDLRTLRIPNILPIALVLFFILYQFLHGGTPNLWQNIASFAAVLVGGTALFAARILGGGDAKLLAATALWFDFTALAILLPVIAIFGGATALLLVSVRRMIPQEALPEGSWKGLRPRGPIPYAVPICVGAILTAQFSGL